jgi:hypothetical protein
MIPQEMRAEFAFRTRAPQKRSCAMAQFQSQLRMETDIMAEIRKLTIAISIATISAACGYYVINSDAVNQSASAATPGSYEAEQEAMAKTFARSVDLSRLFSIR